MEVQQLSVTSALLANSGLDPKKAKKQFDSVQREFDGRREAIYEKFARDPVTEARTRTERSDGSIVPDEAIPGETLRDDPWWEKPEKKSRKKRKKKG